MHERKHNEVIYFIMAAVLPVFFAFSWLISNSQLPATDATDYLMTGYRIYHHFTDNGFWYGILHFDIQRGWRPIFFSVFTVPFLLVSKGNISFAYQAVALGCVFASAVYVYLFSRLVLDRVSSVIAANLICLLPLVQIPILQFFAEAALFPVVIGALYHLIQSDYFRVKKQMIGFIICFSLAIVIRPVEAVTELFFVLIVFLSAGWYQSIFSIKQIMTVIALGFSALFLLLFNVGAHFIGHYPFHPIDGGIYDIKLAKSIKYTLSATLYCMMLTWGCLAWMNFTSWGRRLCTGTGKPLNCPPVILAFTAIFTLVLLWFSSHAFQTYVWVYRTSFGDLADISTNMLMKISSWEVVQYFTHLESTILVECVLLVAMVGFITVGAKKCCDICLSSPCIYLLLLIPFPAWEVLNTIQTAPRKMNLAFPAFILVLLLIGLQRGKLWKLRFTTVTILLVLQFGFALGLVYPTLSQIKSHVANLGFYPEPVRLQPNPHDEVIQFLNQQARQYRLENIGLVINENSALPVDPFLLMMMNRISNESYTIENPHFNVYSDTELHKINGHDALFLTDKSSDMVVSNAAAKEYDKRFETESNPTLKNLYRFLYYFSMNKMDVLGWKLGPCMTTRAVDNNEYVGCLLFVNSK